jgi:hypothetical protein
MADFSLSSTASLSTVTGFYYGYYAAVSGIVKPGDSLSINVAPSVSFHFQEVLDVPISEASDYVVYENVNGVLSALNPQSSDGYYYYYTFPQDQSVNLQISITAKAVSESSLGLLFGLENRGQIDGNPQAYTEVMDFSNVSLAGAAPSVALDVVLGAGGFGTITTTSNGQAVAISSTGSDEAAIAYDDLMPIPNGTWNVVLYRSPANGICLSFSSANGQSDFYDRADIELHGGNTPGDSTGCIVTGNNSVNGQPTNNYLNRLLNYIEGFATIPVADLSPGQFDPLSVSVVANVSGQTIQPSIVIAPTVQKGTTKLDFQIIGLQPSSPMVDKDVNIYFDILGSNDLQMDQTPGLISGAALVTTGPNAGMFEVTIKGTHQNTGVSSSSPPDVSVSLNTSRITDERSVSINIVGYDGTSYLTQPTTNHPNGTAPYNPSGGIIGIQPMLEGFIPVSIPLTRAVADFTGSGTSDVLLQSGPTVVDWIMQNGVYSTGNVLTAGATGYTAVGTGDFIGNGTADVLLQNGGTVVDWIMSNGRYQSGNVLTTGATGFSVVGTGDYNGDGTADVSLQSGGTVVDWIIKNGQYQTGNVVTTGATGFNVIPS